MFTYEFITFVRIKLKMDKKLTLSLDESVIEEAKIFAKSNNTSLSKLIENYLDYLTSKDKDYKLIDSTPLVDSLCGVIDLPENFDYKKHIGNYLQEKYQ